MARTKAQRSASAKKAAATRKRKAAKRSAPGRARPPPPAPPEGVTGMAKAAGNTVENAAKSVFKRAEALRGGGKAKPKRGPRKRG